jgi:hypothetical protein
VKKDEIQLLTQSVGGHNSDGSHDMLVRHGNQQNDSNHDGIMDLAQHSDHSN